MIHPQTERRALKASCVGNDEPDGCAVFVAEWYVTDVRR
jgi:hypothetical protein